MKIKKIELHHYVEEFKSSSWTDDTGNPDWESSICNLSNLWCEEVKKLYPDAIVESETHNGANIKTADCRVDVDMEEEDDEDEFNSYEKGKEIAEEILALEEDLFRDRQEEWYVNTPFNEDEEDEEEN